MYRGLAADACGDPRLAGVSEPRSALLIEVPESESLVREPRTRLDPSAARGMPAHVTVLFPFAPAARLDDAVLRRVAEVSAGCRAFDYRFSSTGWFDDRVVYLAPDDPSSFVVLAERLWATFPEYPPFEGQFAAVVPHLTVGMDPDLDQLREAERAVRAGLPVTGRAQRLMLWAEDEAGQWSRLGSFRIGHDAGFESA